MWIPPKTHFPSPNFEKYLIKAGKNLSKLFETNFHANFMHLLKYHEFLALFSIFDLGSPRNVYFQ
jgi:hypothetical protein